MLNLYLQLRPHAGQYSPKYLHTDIEHLRDRTDGISAQAQTQVLCNRLCECRRIIGGGGIDDS